MDGHHNSSQYPLEGAILKTLAYFDIFHYPLTLFELHRYLYQQKASVLEVESVLASLIQRGIVEERHGYYFLHGRKACIAIRKERYFLSERKIRRALKAARWIAHLPFVEMVAVCNNLSYGNARRESDIDFFIVITSRRLWLMRGIITLLLHFLRLRRHALYIKDRICLSFYVTSDALPLKGIALEEDIYLFFWIATLLPIYERSNFSEKFFQENRWVKGYLPNIFFQKPHLHRRIILNRTAEKIRAVIERIFSERLGDICERVAKNIQLLKMRRNVSSVSHFLDTRVVISDQMLKFHENDRRALYAGLWRQKYEDYAFKHISERKY